MQDFEPIKVRFEVDTSGLRKAENAAGDLGGKMKGKLGVLGVAAGTALGGGVAMAASAAISAATDLIGGAFQEASTMETLTSKTQAVLKSTGNAAGTSADRMKALASSIESVSGAQLDELDILNSQNVLATFTNIKNVAGQGNDIFDQTTKAAANLSAALGQDLQSSSIQLGKALNDPVKGVSALQRVGVSFTAQQKDQIKALVESGRTMDAQKLILAEMNKEFGGSAAALGNTTKGKIGGAVDAVKDSLRNLAAKALPVIANLAKLFVDKFLPALGKLGKFVMDTLGPAWKALTGIFAGFGSKTKGLGAKGGIFDSIGGIAKTVGGIVKQYVMPVFKTFANDVIPNLVSGVKGFWSALSASLLPALNRLKKVFEDNRPALESLARGVATVVGGVYKFISVILKFLLPVLGNLAGFIVTYFSVVISGLIKTVSFLVNLFTNFGGTVSGAWNALKGFVGGIIGKIGSLGGSLFKAAKGLWRRFVDGVLDALKSLPGLVWDILKKIPGVSIIGNALGGLFNKVTGGGGGGTGSTAGRAGNSSVVNNYNVTAQGLTVDAVTRESQRRGRLAAPAGGAA